MTNQALIIGWLAHRPAAAMNIAAHAVVSLLLDDEGDWLGESDFPSGADYIDHITHVMESLGLYEYTDKLQENGKTNQSTHAAASPLR